MDTGPGEAGGMKQARLGRTGLRVSVLGFGTGSRFGDRGRNPPRQATELVRTALDLGINYFDVAPMYGEAEALLGEALAGVAREAYVVATKFFPATAEGEPITPQQLRGSVESSLRRLRCGTIDLLQVHGLRPHWAGPVLDRLGGELEALRREGKFRHLGVTETIVEDPGHEMVARALAAAPAIGAALVAYHPFSPWAEGSALPAAQAADCGVVVMVAVGRSLRDAASVRQFLAAARDRGDIPPGGDPPGEFLDWLGDPFSATPAAAGLRFAAAHPAVSGVLVGTLDAGHLRANAAALAAPPMAAEVRERLRACFLVTDPARWRPADV